MQNRFFFIIFSIFLTACQNKIGIDGFNNQDWQKDEYGCQGIRIQLAEELLAEKTKLLGYNEKEVRDFLGKPDEISLYKRNQKFFKYYVNPSADICDSNAHNAVVKTLNIKFNATNRSDEVYMEIVH